MRRLLAIAVVAAVAGAGGAWAGVAVSTPSAPHTPTSGSTTTALAPVVLADLQAQQTIAGTIAYDGSDTVVLPAGTTPAAIAQAQQKVAADQTALANAEQAAADVAASENVAVSLATVAANSTPAAVTNAQVHAVQAEHQAGGQVATAAATLAADRSTLAAVSKTALVPGGTLTDVAGPGQIVHQGEPLYLIDGRVVPLMYGAVTAWRVLGPGVDGPDVAALNQDLAAMGFGGDAGPHFGDMTTAGVRRLQHALGLDETGVLDLGSYVFEPAPVRVATVVLRRGSPAQPGATVLTATSATQVVIGQVPLSDVGSVKAGDAVTVDLPTGQNGAPGRVRSIGSSVTAPPSNTQPGQGSQGPGGATSVAATVTFSDPSVAVGLDQAAVLLHITTGAVRNVLAVPVVSLLALGGGGEGVEVVSGSTHHVIAVQTGLFSGSQVEISGPGLAAGMQVVVPAA